MMINEAKGTFGMFSQVGKRTAGSFNIFSKQEDLMNEFSNKINNAQPKEKKVIYYIHF